MELQISAIIQSPVLCITELVLVGFLLLETSGLSIAPAYIRLNFCLLSFASLSLIESNSSWGCFDGESALDTTSTEQSSFLTSPPARALCLSANLRSLRSMSLVLSPDYNQVLHTTLSLVLDCYSINDFFSRRLVEVCCLNLEFAACQGFALLLRLPLFERSSFSSSYCLRMLLLIYLSLPSKSLPGDV